MSVAGTSYDCTDAFKKLMLGGTAAAISKTTTAPIDRVKLVLQVQGSQQYAVTQYAGMRDCFRRIFTEQGITALWRGNSAGIARCFPSHALNFAFRDVYRQMFLAGVDRKRNFWRFFTGTVAAGGAGGATTLLLVYPLDFARTRLAVDMKRDGAKRYNGMIDCLYEIQKREGWLSWYRGFCASVQFVIASRAVFFGLFDTIRTHIANDSGQLHFATTWIMAQSCLVVSGLSCYPLDTVRRRLMMQSGKKIKEFKNTKECWIKIATSEGVQGFYKGALTNSFRSAGGALIITLYYEFTKYL